MGNGETVLKLHFGWGYNKIELPILFFSSTLLLRKIFSLHNNRIPLFWYNYLLIYLFIFGAIMFGWIYWFPCESNMKKRVISKHFFYMGSFKVSWFSLRMHNFKFKETKKDILHESKLLLKLKTNIKQEI